MSDYPDTRRVLYGSGAQFIPTCEACGKFVKADKTILVSEGAGLHPGPNATCSKCGRTRMVFEGFVGG